VTQLDTLAETSPWRTVAGVRVLIVDDSKPMRMILARALRQSGREADVVEASNGIDALATLNATSVDLVLSDWNMPEMDGLEFLREVRSYSSSVPFVFVTTEWTPAQRELAQMTGATALLEKPFTPDALDATLRSIGW